MEKIKSKTTVRVIISLAVLLFAASFAFIIVCGLLKDQGYGDFWWPLVGLCGFFISDILALILLVGIMRDALQHDLKDKSRLYDAAAFSYLSAVSPDAVRERFIAHRFTKAPEDLLRRKMFSLTKDSICYYVNCRPAENIEAALAEEFQCFNELNEPSKNVCLLLFLYKNQPTAADDALLRETARTFILSETLLPVQTFQTCVLVLVDTATQQGRYLEVQHKGSISVYAHACRLLKKYFAAQTP